MRNYRYAFGHCNRILSAGTVIISKGSLREAGMMDLPMGPIKLSELANKWGKTVSEIINLLVATMTAGCWYSGPIISAAGCRMVFNGHGKFDMESFEGWVVPRGPDLAPLLTQKNVKLKYFDIMTYPIAPRPSMVLANYSPAILHPSGHIEHGELIITLDDLVIMPSEVTRMEREYPELTAKRTPASSEEEPLKGMKEIANFLGVSLGTVKNLKKGKKLDFFKEGGAIMAFRSKIQHLSKNKTTSEP